MMKDQNRNSEQTFQNGEELLFKLGRSSAPNQEKFQTKLLSRLNHEYARPLLDQKEDVFGWLYIPAARPAYASMALIAFFLCAIILLNYPTDKPIANVIATIGNTNINDQNSPVVHPGETIETSDNGQASLLLADHSILRVDHNSNVIIDKNRQVTLKKGRLYAEVAKTAQQDSFKIQTNNVQVIVLGTAFEVESKQDDVSVKVTEGTVKVVWKNNETILTAGEAINIKGQTSAQPEKLNQQYSPKWITKLVQTEANSPIIQAIMQEHFPSRSLNVK